MPAATGHPQPPPQPPPPQPQPTGRPTAMARRPAQPPPQAERPTAARPTPPIPMAPRPAKPPPLIPAPRPAKPPPPRPPLAATGSGVSARSTAMIPRPEMIADFLLRIFITPSHFLALSSLDEAPSSAALPRFTRAKAELRVSNANRAGRFRLARLGLICHGGRGLLAALARGLQPAKQFSGAGGTKRPAYSPVPPTGGAVGRSYLR